MKTFTYLAIAYSGVEADSFKHSIEAVSIYAKTDIVVYSPIAHCHPVAQEHELPTGYAFWKENAYGMIRGATALDILLPEGWTITTADSKGVKSEARYAHGRGLPVRIVTIKDGEIVEHDDGNELLYQILGGM